VSWEIAASIAEIVSAIAVVVSLLYLANEVRQNTIASRASTHQKYTEAVPIISATALHPEIGDNKAPCAGNSHSISKRGNAVSADFRAQPEGPGPFFRNSALFVTH